MLDKLSRFKSQSLFLFTKPYSTIILAVTGLEKAFIFNSSAWHPNEQLDPVVPW